MLMDGLRGSLLLLDPRHPGPEAAGRRRMTNSVDLLRALVHSVTGPCSAPSIAGPRLSCQLGAIFTG